ncbi:MAG: rRNA cytosine-C5-methyltransferase [Dysgonamonadaceae bacterium]|jgi:16S rRNA C967 or C1407 C5-methylase (RsmB/RsmF family)/NOL1/NOP2/fmu family ribosome biogenesis protein|nr:rRNA cytosine-C5-methyltransferase [Dysgonamonadaceae bacterium]
MQLPEAFISRTKALLGDEWEAFEQALNQEKPTSIRFNPKKTGIEILFDVESPVPWASNAYYLSSRPVFTLDPFFHAGCYYVQEASSMFLEHYVKNYVHEPVKALDLCAAPGGKSTHLSAVLPEGSLLVANEVIRQRANILSENLIKWGNPQTIVANNYPADIGKLKEFFDLIVCDLPCSGEGMFRKDAGAITEWSVQNVKFCAERQRQIISDIFPALKHGGILIYSTCTYNREENEDNIEWICREFEAELLEAPRRFMPHKTRGEGFFIAAIRKGEEKDTWRKVHADHYKDYLFLKKSLKIVFAGMALEDIKGKNFAPPHALAMSTALPEKTFPRWELDLETALKYLRKESLSNVPAEIPRGFVLVAYRNQALGFVKNIGNRANNLYPHEWRIRS